MIDCINPTDGKRSIKIEFRDESIKQVKKFRASTIASYRYDFKREIGRRAAAAGTTVKLIWHSRARLEVRTNVRLEARVYSDKEMNIILK